MSAMYGTVLSGYMTKLQTVLCCSQVYSGEELLRIDLQQKDEQLDKKNKTMVILQETIEKMEEAMEQMQRKVGRFVFGLASRGK